MTHPGQLRSNASGVHLALLAPSQVRFCSSVDELPPAVQNGECPGWAILYPDESAVGADELCRAGAAPVTDVIVVDSLVRPTPRRSMP